MPHSEFKKSSLRTYTGTGKRPDDFDAFWDNRKEMLDQVKLSYTCTPNPNIQSKQVQIIDLEMISFDGAKIYAKYLRPVMNHSVPCVLQFHGYPGSSRSYFELSAFVDAGFAVIAMDCRGQGGKSVDLGGVTGTTVSGHLIMGVDDVLDQHLYVKIYSDVYLMSRLAAQLPEIDETRIFANGASQGAALAAVCAALNPNIHKTALLYPFLSDFERVFKLGYDLVAYEGLRYYSRWFDPEGNHQAEFFSKLAYLDVRHFAPRIRSEVIFGISLADTICPPSTQYAVYNALNCPKKVIEYPGKGHEQIHDFDDRIISFFEKSTQTILKRTTLPWTPLVETDSPLIAYGEGEDPLIIFFNTGQTAGSHHLRRFLACGYDVLSVPSIHEVLNQKKLQTILTAISQAVNQFCKDRPNIPITVVGEAEGAALALCYGGFDSRVKCALLQSPLSKDIPGRILNQAAAHLRGKILMGYGGLEPLENQRFIENLFSQIQADKTCIIYPKYMMERINAFEDRKFQFLNEIE